MQSVWTRVKILLFTPSPAEGASVTRTSIQDLLNVGKINDAIFSYQFIYLEKNTITNFFQTTIYLTDNTKQDVVKNQSRVSLTGPGTLNSRKGARDILANQNAYLLFSHFAGSVC